MKNLLAIVAIYITLQCSPVTAGADLEKDAQKLVSQYLGALTQGNTELVLDIIGGGLLESRRSLLQNPGYSSYLTQIYSNASVVVTGSRQLTASSFAVDVVIEKAVDEQFGLIFLVEVVNDKGKKLLIVAEQEAKRQ